jgi:hypothetical protein
MCREIRQILDLKSLIVFREFFYAANVGPGQSTEVPPEDQIAPYALSVQKAGQAFCKEYPLAVKVGQDDHVICTIKILHESYCVLSAALKAENTTSNAHSSQGVPISIAFDNDHSAFLGLLRKAV